LWFAGRWVEGGGVVVQQVVCVFYLSLKRYDLVRGGAGGCGEAMWVFVFVLMLAHTFVFGFIFFVLGCMLFFSFYLFFFFFFFVVLWLLCFGWDGWDGTDAAMNI
jgi:hypothetical protein